MKTSFSKSVPFQRLRNHGRTQVESLLLIGLVGLGGVAGFDRLGDASETLIAERSVASAASAGPGIELGGTQQAVVGVFADVAELGRRASKVAPDGNVIELYGEVPLSSRIPDNLDSRRADQAFELAMAKLRKGGDGSTAAALRELAPFGPGANLVLAAIEDVRRALGEEAFRRARLGINFRRVEPETNALYAAYFAAKGTTNAVENVERARAVLPDGVYARLEALVDIFGEGIDEARRDALFGRPGQQVPANVDIQQTMAKVLPRFEEDIGAFELTRLEGNNVAALFTSLQKTNLSPEAFAYLREALAARFDAAQRTSRGNRRSVTRRLLTEVLPAVIEGDADAALGRLDAIDQSDTLAAAVTGREQIVAELREAVQGAAARFRRGDDALPPVQESVVDGDLFARVRSEQLEGLPQAYATFLRGVVSALPTPAPSYVALDIEELVRLAAQRAALGRVDETRGFSTLIVEASADADQARLVTRDLERFADRFARGRQQAGLPEARTVQSADEAPNVPVDPRFAFEVPTKLEKVPSVAYFTALEEGLLERIALRGAGFDEVVAELVAAEPGTEAQARLFARVLFDIKDDVGADTFAATVKDFGTGFDRPQPATRALYAITFATRAGVRPVDVQRAVAGIGDALSDGVKEEILALREVFEQGLDEGRRDNIFGRPVAPAGSDDAVFRDPVEVQPESTTAAQARRALGVADAGVP